jgi:hypothetical protein
MPQIGQVPGPSCRISGCIGQIQIEPGGLDRRRRAIAQKLLRIGDEFRTTPRTAKMEGLALMLGMMRVTPGSTVIPQTGSVTLPD